MYFLCFLLYNNFMILYIDTTKGHRVRIALRDGQRTIVTKNFLAKFTQAEKTLPEIDKLVKRAGINLTAIKNIEVANQGGGFTALRLGVVLANALGYALGIPVRGTATAQKNHKKFDFDIIPPIYDQEPNITYHKSEYTKKL